MPTLSDEQILDLLEPFAPSESVVASRVQQLAPKFSIYLQLLLRWNARTNLTAVREPEEIVQRHFGESIFTAAALEGHITSGSSLLDFGSGAGFPGLPIQLCLPEMRICLAESQGKKASFLREAVRTLNLTTEVWAGRVETMPSDRKFDFVAMRAVDKMNEAMRAALKRVAHGGRVVVLSAPMEVEADWTTVESRAIPLSSQRLLTVLQRL